MLNFKHQIIFRDSTKRLVEEHAGNGIQNMKKKKKKEKNDSTENDEE